MRMPFVGQAPDSPTRPHGRRRPSSGGYRRFFRSPGHSRARARRAPGMSLGHCTACFISSPNIDADSCAPYKCLRRWGGRLFYRCPFRQPTTPAYLLAGASSWAASLVIPSRGRFVIPAARSRMVHSGSMHARSANPVFAWEFSRGGTQSAQEFAQSPPCLIGVFRSSFARLGRPEVVKYLVRCRRKHSAFPSRTMLRRETRPAGLRSTDREVVSSNQSQQTPLSEQ
jgi:hypothetical protein